MAVALPLSLEFVPMGERSWRQRGRVNRPHYSRVEHCLTGRIDGGGPD
jgi:hypothetical protein